VKGNRWLLGVTAVVLSGLGPSGCSGGGGPARPPLVCGWSPSSSASALSTGSVACGAGDPNLPPEPSLPTPDKVCLTLLADKSTPDESHLDMMRIQAALTMCKGGGAVKLMSSGDNHVFVSGHLTVDSTILWIDAGTTLYASRDPSQYQIAGNCGLTGISDSGACFPLLTVSGTSPGIVGEGIIDGQGGEPIYGKDYSWWDLSNALRASNGSGPNPALIEVRKGSGTAVTGFVMYKITLHNSPKFHVKLAATSPDNCATPGDGFTVWGVTILTPAVARTSTGFRPTPYYTRNTDGIDPGEFALTNCGVIACSQISTGDDQVALKAAHGLQNIVIAHNNFGTGHGMSLGSETNGGASNINVYDLTIDADSRWNGAPASDTSDFNGIRVKSDESRGGQPVDGITFTDVCMRDLLNPIVIDSSYNPLYGGTSYPIFKAITLKNVRDVTCMGLIPPVVILQGFNDAFRAGPITLDNVIIDGITPLDVAGQYSDVTLGPGNVNFMPSGCLVPPANSSSDGGAAATCPGSTVTVTNHISGETAPKPCTFPQLPVAQ
jgi:polygalacturonase